MGLRISLKGAYLRLRYGVAEPHLTVCSQDGVRDAAWRLGNSLNGKLPDLEVLGRYLERSYALVMEPRSQEYILGIPSGATGLHLRVPKSDSFITLFFLKEKGRTKVYVVTGGEYAPNQAARQLLDDVCRSRRHWVAS